MIERVKTGKARINEFVASLEEYRKHNMNESANRCNQRSVQNLVGNF